VVKEPNAASLSLASRGRYDEDLDIARESPFGFERNIVQSSREANWVTIWIISRETHRGSINSVLWRSDAEMAEDSKRIQSSILLQRELKVALPLKLRIFELSV